MKPFQWPVLFLAAIVIVALVACGGGASPTQAPPTTAPGQPTTGPAQPTTAAAQPTATTAAPSGGASPTPAPSATPTLLPGRTGQQLLGWSSSDAENNLLNQMIASYNQSQQKYEAFFNPVPNYDQALPTSLAGGAPPDAFYVDSLPFPNYVKNSALATPPQGALDNPSDFYPSLAGAFTVNGTLYCPPKDFSTLGLIYNKKMLDAAGVKVPTTWDELSAAAKKLTDKSKGVYGLALSADAARLLAFVYQAGGHMLNNGKMDVNTPEAKKAVDYYVGLITDGNAVTPDKVDSGWNGEAFGKQKVAMTVEGNWMVPFMKQSYPDVSYGIAELPAGPSGKATLAFTVCYAVAKNAKDPAGSWQLVNYLTNAQGMQQWTDLGLAMPTRQSLRDHWSSKFPEQAAFLAGAAYAHPWSFAAGFSSVMDTFNKGIQSAIAGQETTDQVLSDTQKAGEQALSTP